MQPAPGKISLTKFKIGHYRDYLPSIDTMDIDRVGLSRPTRARRVNQGSCDELDPLILRMSWSRNRCTLSGSCSSPNTVHLRIRMAFVMLIGGGGLSARGRSGKQLILRLTPRGLRRFRLETTRSWRISSSTASWKACLRRGGIAGKKESFRRTTRTACRKESRSGSSSAFSAASCIRPRMAK